MILVTTTLCACVCLLMQEPQDQEPQAPPAAEEPEADVPVVTHDPPPIGYRTPEQFVDALRLQAAASDGMTLVRIGKSPEGRPLLVATFAGPRLGAAATPGSPEVLVVANLEGDRLATSEVAMGLIEGFATLGSPLLEKVTVHVMPLANPDAMAHALADSGPWRGAPTDNDRDGRLDEDDAADLDGDGRILWMRVPAAGGSWLADPGDPRSSREADADEAESGSFRLLREGLDEDGDRQENEDGAGGVALEANFPHRWQQYAAAAGAFQLSEPESRALADFVLLHPSISLVLVLDDEDNLASPPKGKDKSNAQSTEPLEDDARLLKILGKRFYHEDDEIRGAEHQSGNFADWVYYQRGALVLESTLWSPPLDVADADGEELDKDASEERKLLAWADAWYPDTAFQPWTPFQHAQLGEVELGGWMPLVRVNPPADLLPDLTTRTADFLDGLAQDFARLSWEDVEVEALDEAEVFEVRARLVNHGLLPTTTAMGRKNRRPLPLRVYLELPDGGQLLVGRPRTTIESLDGLGGMQELHWIYRLADGSGPARLRAVSSSAGEALITLEVN